MEAGKKLTFGRRISLAQTDRTIFRVVRIVCCDQIERVYGELLSANTKSDVDCRVAW